MRSRVIAALAVTGLALSVLPAGAARAAGGGLARVENGNVVYEAVNGDVNNVRLNGGNGAFTVDDVVRVVPGTGCRHPNQGDDTLVQCTTTAASPRLIVRAGDLNDVVRNLSRTRVLLVGQDGDDRLFAGPGGGQLGGEAGNDELRGGPVNDLLVDGPGDDRVFGGGGDDVLSSAAGGSAATDVDELHGGGGNDFMGAAFEAGPDRLFGEAGDDRMLNGVGNATLDGGPGIDNLQAGDGNDLLRGGDGDDSMVGDQGSGGGDDTMLGGAGNDEMLGGVGNDTLDGGPGDNRLDGGPHTPPGGDRCVNGPVFVDCNP